MPVLPTTSIIPARPAVELTTKRMLAAPARAGRICNMSFITTTGSLKLTRILWMALPMGPGVRWRKIEARGARKRRSNACCRLN